MFAISWRNLQLIICTCRFSSPHLPLISYLCDTYNFVCLNWSMITTSLIQFILSILVTAIHKLVWKLFYKSSNFVLILTNRKLYLRPILSKLRIDSKYLKSIVTPKINSKSIDLWTYNQFLGVRIDLLGINRINSKFW